jgi:hypothetical protein
LPGGDEPKKLTKQEKKLAKYKDDMDAVNLNKDDYANGINQNRSCTDFMCLIVFLVFLGAIGGVTIYSVKKGNVETMIAPIDTHLNFCGIEGPRAEYEKMYFTYYTTLTTISTSDILNSGICVKKCPVEGSEIEESNVHPDDWNYI